MYWLYQNVLHKQKSMKFTHFWRKSNGTKMQIQLTKTHNINAHLNSVVIILEKFSMRWYLDYVNFYWMKVNTNSKWTWFGHWHILGNSIDWTSIIASKYLNDKHPNKNAVHTFSTIMECGGERKLVWVYFSNGKNKATWITLVLNDNNNSNVKKEKQFWALNIRFNRYPWVIYIEIRQCVRMKAFDLLTVYVIWNRYHRVDMSMIFVAYI